MPQTISQATSRQLGDCCLILSSTAKIQMMNQPNVKVEFRVAATFLLSLALLLLLLFSCLEASAQTCTLSGSGNVDWDNTSPPTCVESGRTTANSTILVIPTGMNVTFAGTDTWAGTTVQVKGTLTVPNAGGGARIDANIEVYLNGVVSLDAKLNLGPEPCTGSCYSGCNYSMSVFSGGRVDLNGTASDRLVICGNWMLSGKSTTGGGGGPCSIYPASPPPYCEPTVPGPYWAGPAGFDKNGGTPLPVKLLFFNAYSAKNSVQLKWATASEKNSEYFTIERSRNGRDFEEVGRVASAGNTITRVDYDFLDEDVLLGRNYYRLKQVDFDGTYEYFNITFADTDGKKAVLLYPNPVQHSRLQFKLNFTSDEQGHAKVFNSTGALVSSFSFSGSQYVNESNLKPGAYLLKVSVGNEMFTQRFVVP